MRLLHRYSAVLFAAFMLSGCARFGTSLPGPLPTSADTVRLRKDVEYLAAERLEGRGLASPGLEQAAKFLVARFSAIGLEPGGPEGSFYQRFDVIVSARPGVRTNVAFAIGEPDAPEAGAGKEVIFGVNGYDFVPAGFSSEGEFRGPLVFGGACSVAGSGDKAGGDFGEMNLEGSIVLCLGETAGGAASEENPHAGVSDRFRAFGLRQKKAAAVLFISAARDDSGEPLPDFQPAPMNTEIGIPVGYVRRSVVARLLESATGGKMKLLPGKAALVPDVVAGGQVELIREAVSTPNVVGILRAGARDRLAGTALLGAHYDHLGWGGPNSLEPDVRAVHPGADDNASGVAVLLETARLLAASRERLARDVWFVAFAGEEEGLLGSAAFVKSRTAEELAELTGMLNLDMVGRISEDRLYVFGAPTGKEFADVLEDLTGDHGLKLEVSGDSYGPSDHASFIAHEVPSLHFFTGAHADYHKPGDTPEKLDYDGMARVSELSARMLLALATDPARPTWTAGEMIPARGGKEEKTPGYGAYFGSVPDFAPIEGGGVRLAAVRPGSPAEAAGIRAGDVLRKLGPHEIRNLYDFTYALRAHEPGETLDAWVEREGRLLRFSVTLGSR